MQTVQGANKGGETAPNKGAEQGGDPLDALRDWYKGAEQGGSDPEQGGWYLSGMTVWDDGGDDVLWAAEEHPTLTKESTGPRFGEAYGPLPTVLAAVADLLGKANRKRMVRKGESYEFTFRPRTGAGRNETGNEPPALKWRVWELQGDEGAGRAWKEVAAVSTLVYARRMAESLAKTILPLPRNVFRIGNGTASGRWEVRGDGEGYSETVTPERIADGAGDGWGCGDPDGW